MQEALVKHTVKSKAKNMFKVDTQAGNACIYMTFVLLNFALFLSSLGILGADIFLFVKIKSNIFSWIFLGLGLALFTCSLMSFKLRRSIHLLGFYLLIIFTLFFFQLITTLVLLIKKSALIDKLWDLAGKPSEEMQLFKDELNNNIKNVSVAMILFSLILLSAFISGMLYRNSVKGRTEDLKDKLKEDYRQAE